MSLSIHESLFCLECEERHHFPHDMLLYQSPGKQSAASYRDWDWCSMLTDQVWCFECRRPAYVERVPSPREFRVARWFRARPDIALPENVEDELLTLQDESFDFLATHLVERRGNGRCLSCGSHSAHQLQLAIDIVVNLKHPDCGGVMRLDRCYINAIAPRTIRWFDIDGRLIDVQEDCF